MKVIFMGTPDFAVQTLKRLISSGHEVTGVVTQPDKPKGRGKALSPTPVKEVALEAGIPVFQPRRVRDSEALETLRGIEADVIVVVAFGQLIPKEILEMKKYGCINVHGSLLPKYRGGGSCTVGSYRWGKGIRRDDDADGRRPGYRGYAAESSDSAGGKRDWREPV